MKTMTSRERFQTALDLGVPDRVPMLDYIDEKVILGMDEIMGLSRGEEAEATRKGEESKAFLDTYCDVIEVYCPYSLTYHERLLSILNTC